MKIFNKVVLTSIFLASSLSPTAFAQEESKAVQVDPVEESVEPIQVLTPAPQIARFTAWIDIIERDLFAVAQADVPDHLVAKKTRASVFNIQALGRLYKDEARLFSEMRDRFRELEDSIGEYQKWIDYENQGIRDGASEAVISRLKANREHGRALLENALVSSGFLPSNGQKPYLKALRESLHAYAWKSVEDDRKLMVEKLSETLEKAKVAQYNFAHLEEGNGVHEFRRKMRWFSMETRGLNGLIVLKPRTEACPVESWSYLIRNDIAGTKYAVLPPAATETQPIALSACLYLKVARMVEDVNQIKAKAEAIDSLSENTPTDLLDEADRERVQQMYDDVMANDLFGRLQRELEEGLLLPSAN